MRNARKRHSSPNRRLPPALKYRGGVNKNETRRQSPRAMKKLRMREWLEELLDQHQCKGLEWISRAEKKFKIMWCHASRSDFDTSEHADLFIRYARFKGKMKLAASSKTNYNSKLRSNFRSALHSLVDCMQLDDTDAPAKGHNSVKVYQFIEPAHPVYQEKKRLKNQSQSSNRSKKSVESERCNNQDRSTTTIPIKNEELQERSGDIYSILSAVTTSTNEEADEIVPLYDMKDNLLIHQLSEDSVLLDENQIISSDDLTLLGIPEDQNCFPVPSFTFQSNTTNPGTSFIIMDNADISTVEQEVFSTVAIQDVVQPPPTELPNSSALGVSDEFQPPIKNSHQTLTSGGSVLVKKERPYLPQIPEVQMRWPVSDCNVNDCPDLLKGVLNTNQWAKDPILTGNLMLTQDIQQGATYQEHSLIELSAFSSDLIFTNNSQDLNANSTCTPVDDLLYEYDYDKL